MCCPRAKDSALSRESALAKAPSIPMRPTSMRGPVSPAAASAADGAGWKVCMRVICVGASACAGGGRERRFLA